VIEKVVERQVIKMMKVSIEVPYDRARFAVGLRAQSIQRALSIAAARYPDGIVARATFPPRTQGFFVEDSAGWVGSIEPVT
jgi:hypothetical protein